jgi:hypothetical protein
MKITVLATGTAPTHYSFNGEVITAYYDGLAEDFDLSVIQSNNKFTGLSVDSLNRKASQIIRAAYRDESGELHVTICQQVGSGHWEAGPEIDAADYQPDGINVVLREDKPSTGKPWAMTSIGKVEPV